MFKPCCILIILALALPASAGSILHSPGVSGDNVRLRDAPSTEGKILTTMRKGDRVERVEYGEEWFQVKHLKSGIIGWMHQDYYAYSVLDPVDLGGIQFADILETAPNWAILGKFRAGLPVSLIGKEGHRAGVTASHTSEVNMATDEVLQGTTLGLVAAESDFNPAIAALGEVQFQTIAPAPISDPGQVSTLKKQVEIVPISYFTDNNYTMDTQVFQLKESKHPLMLFRTQYTRDEQVYETLNILYRGAEVVVHHGCLHVFEPFTLNGRLFLLLSFGDCDSGDYNKCVFMIDGQGLHHVYHNSSFGC